MKSLNLISYDVGGSGGKVQVGTFDGSTLTSHTAHRYRNAAIRCRGEQYWDFFKMLEERDIGVQKAAQVVSGDIAAIGSTTFGQCFVLLDRQGRPFSIPYAVYPERLDAALRAVDACIPLKELHLKTAAEIRNYIAASQLMAYQVHGEDGLLAYAHKIAFLPDALNYSLCGVLRGEKTAVAIGGMYDQFNDRWAEDVLERLGISREKLPDPVDSGTVCARVEADCAARLGLNPGTVVVNAPGHDTASAAYALPDDDDPLFVCVGTMALIATELRHPLANDYTFNHGLSNYMSPDRRSVLTSAVRCMWHLEKAIEYFRRRGVAISYQQTAEMARQATPMRNVVNLDDDGYLSRPEMLPEIIAKVCEMTGQAGVRSQEELFRCIYDSIIWEIVRAFDTIREATGNSSKRLTVLGGGGNNAFLMQCLADATGCEVQVPDYEATSYGVLLSELVALGEIGSRGEIKQLIRRSVQIRRYEPQNSLDLSAAEALFQDRFPVAVKSVRL